MALIHPLTPTLKDLPGMLRLSSQAGHRLPSWLLEQLPKLCLTCVVCVGPCVPAQHGGWPGRVQGGLELLD